LQSFLFYKYPIAVGKPGAKIPMIINLIYMPKYGKKSQSMVKKAMHEFKRGKLKSGPGGKGGRVRSRKQAIAIGLSEARKAGAKVPKKKK
jgi:hypothetical protein